ncbi:MAG: hypothetical protein H6737_10095 [Alphaproteobacteria bacterium]|nr:hypothetical protein [Alphaproteobacteria bacterium]
MYCRFCGSRLQPVHGHGACLNSGCPMFGLNQDECCSGDACPPSVLETPVLTDPATAPSAPGREDAPTDVAGSQDPTRRNQRSSSG